MVMHTWKISMIPVRSLKTMLLRLIGRQRKPAGLGRKSKDGSVVMDGFWYGLKSLFRSRRHKELPDDAKDALKLFKDTLCRCSSSQRVTWFGSQVLRYIDEHPDSVLFEDGVILIDVSVTSAVPGDWGDEMFDAMFSTEETLGWNVIKRSMSIVPNDHHPPAHLRSKEHFVAVHWIVSKNLEEKG